MPAIHPVVDEGLGNSAYVVELGDGRALVVDPARDPTPYLKLARWRRLQLAYTAETHLHADFLTGNRELAAAAGAEILAPRASRLGFAHRGLEDGEEVDLGGLALRTLATPGHTPEHVSYLLLDTGRPRALFSGGALLAGGVARTDLASPELTEPLARAAYRSLHQRLLPLPDDLGVHPTHGAGSFCSAPGAGERSTTIGAERRHNRLLAAPDEDAFVAELLAGFGSYPPYFLRLRDRNRAGPELLGSDWQVVPLVSTGQVRARVAGSAVLVDARPVAAFAAGHIPGALSIALRPQFASWLGWLLDDAQPLVFVLDEGQDRGELVRQCRTIGYDHLVASWPAAWAPGWRPASPWPGSRWCRPSGWMTSLVWCWMSARPARSPPATSPERSPSSWAPSRATGYRRASRWAGHPDVWPRRAGHDRRQPVGPRRPQGPARRPRRPEGVAAGHPRGPGPLVNRPALARPAGLRLGLRANLAQFSLLIGINALVGGMVGQNAACCHCSPPRSSA
jgi:hydroxyacylglutathione hydrolase